MCCDKVGDLTTGVFCAMEVLTNMREFICMGDMLDNNEDVKEVTTLLSCECRGDDI